MRGLEAPALEGALDDDDADDDDDKDDDDDDGDDDEKSTLGDVNKREGHLNVSPNAPNATTELGALSI